MRKYVALGMAAVAVGAALVGRRIRRLGEESEHVSETEEAYRNAGARILILGAGFGGLATALKLDQQLRASDDFSILAVDRTKDILFSPLLWPVENGRA